MSFNTLQPDEIVQRYNSDYSITEKLNDYIRNYDWQAGFNDVIRNNLPRDDNGKVILNNCPENAALWLMLSASFEDVGSEVYEKIDSFVKRSVDVETCNYDSLYSISDLLGFNSNKLLVNYPLEIKSLLEIFSIGKRRVSTSGEILLDKDIEFLSGDITTTASGTMSGYDLSAETFVQATSTIEPDWTPTQQTSIISISGNTPYEDFESYTSFIEDQFYNVFEDNITVENFLQEYYDKIYVSKTNTSENILDTEEDETSIKELKLKLYLPESFSAKDEADSIIAGRKRKYDFTTDERTLIEAEIERRSVYEKFGNSPENTEFRRFKYEKERKFREYVKFIEDVSILARETTIDTDYSLDLMEISLDDYKFFDYYFDIPPQSGGVPVSGDMIEYAVHFLRNVCLNVFYKREDIKTTAQKFKHIGTNEVIELLISDYLYKNFSSRDKWNFYEFPELSAFSPTFSGILLGGTTDYLSGALYNKVRVIEYVDETEYYNIETVATSGDSDVNVRYWEDTTTRDASDATSGDIYNFYKNLGVEGSYDDILDLLNAVYDAGATSATLATLTADTIDDSLSGYVSGNMSGMYLKYFGNTSGDIPWVNDKNQIHPSVALHPYLWSLQEEDTVGFILDPVYSFNTTVSSDLISDLDRRIDENGSIINLWQSDAVTMGSYEDGYQFSPNFDRFYAENEKIDYDGPFIFEALSAYLDYVTSGLTTDNISAFYLDWYSHLNLNETFETKIKWQLENHEADILRMADKQIFQFGIDKFGSQYTLFKDDNEYQTAGEIWVKYKNHPLSFPLANNLSGEREYQLDISSFYDDAEDFLNASTQTYEFELVTLGSKNILWAHTAGPDTSNPINSRSGVVYYMTLNLPYEDNITYYANRLEGNNWSSDISSNSGEFVGVYTARGFEGDSFVIASRSGYTSSEVITPDALGLYSLQFNFQVYDDLHGITPYAKTITTKYPLYTDADNQFNRIKLNKFRETLSVTYESSNVTFSGNEPWIFNGTGNNGKFNAEYNTAKQIYHNGFTVIDWALNDGDTVPTSYVVRYYNGYNDVGRQSIEAWEGYIGSEHPIVSSEPVGDLSTALTVYNVNADKYIGLEFLGMSDPSTSARFDVDEMDFFCFNTNDEYFGMWASNVYPTWEEATFPWTATYGDELSGIDFTKWVPMELDGISGDYVTWESKVSLYRLFTTPGEEWTFGSLGSDDIFYSVTVTYNGRGCQKFDIQKTPITV